MNISDYGIVSKEVWVIMHLRLSLDLDLIQALWNPNRMALHDKIGETIVIKLQKKQPQIDNVSVLFSL